MVKILVAEDDDIMRITVVDHLRLQGWMADEVVNGAAALVMMKMRMITDYVSVQVRIDGDEDDY